MCRSLSVDNIEDEEAGGVLLLRLNTYKETTSRSIGHGICGDSSVNFENGRRVSCSCKVILRAISL